MDELVRKYQEIASKFLALGSEGAVQGRLDEAALKDMRANFIEDGPLYIPGKCEVLTTYIPVEHQPIIDFFSETVETITPLFQDDLPYCLVPPRNYHISLVMIQDLRPVDMENEEKRALTLTESKTATVRRIFAEAMNTRKPERYDCGYSACSSHPVMEQCWLRSWTIARLSN